MADIDADDRAQALDAFAKAGANAPLAGDRSRGRGRGADGLGVRVIGAQKIAGAAR